MQKDGLVPIAFGDKDAWPALGTFDQINFRTNGYDFHVELMAGKASWTDAKVRAAFDNWAEILPYSQEGPSVVPGRTRRRRSCRRRPACIWWAPSWASSSRMRPTVTTSTSSPSRRSTPPSGQDTVEAPTDGFMLAKSPKNKAGSVQLLEYLGTPEAEQIYLKSDPSVVAASTTADTSSYSPLQKKAYDDDQRREAPHPVHGPRQPTRTSPPR